MRSLLISVLLHVLAIAVLLWVSSRLLPPPSQPDPIVPITFVEISGDRPQPAGDRPQTQEPLKTVGDRPHPPDTDGVRPQGFEKKFEEKLIKSEKKADLPDSVSPVKASPVHASPVIASPFAVNRIAPKYPRSARRRGHEGRVTVEAEIATDGRVCQVRVVAGSGYAELDAAAVEAVRTSEFHPAQSNNCPVVGKLRIPIVFTLRLTSK